MPSSIAKGIDALIRHLAEAMLWMSALFVVGLLLVGSADVIGTQAFRVSVPSGIEIQEALMGLVIFSALAAIQKRRKHIVVDIVSQTFGPKLRRASELLTLVVGTLAFSIFAWQQWLLAARSIAIWELSPGFVAFPLWSVKAFACAGAVIAALEFARQLVRALVFWREGDPELAGAAPVPAH